jgi:hypothetical protein
MKNGARTTWWRTPFGVAVIGFLLVTAFLRLREP